MEWKEAIERLRNFRTQEANLIATLLEDMAKDGGEKEELDRLAIFLDELSRFSLYAKSLLGHVTYIRKTNY